MYNNNNNGYIGYRVYEYVRELYKIEYPYYYGHETLWRNLNIICIEQKIL